MLNVPFRSLKARIIAHEAVEGALLAENVRGGCTLLETQYAIESDADPALIAAVLRNAHNVCIVGNTVRNGLEQRNVFTLNGSPIDPQAYPPLGQTRHTR